VQSLLAEMDASGVEKAIICEMGSRIVFKTLREIILLVELSKQNPKRFVRFASVNPSYGRDAIIELRSTWIPKRRRKKAGSKRI